LVLHVAANVVWIGSILAVAVVLTSTGADAKTRGALGLEVYKKLSVPAFVAAFFAGGIRLALTPEVYFMATKYMHGKLTLAAVVIGLHHAIGARANKLATGKETDAGPTRTLAVVLLVAVVGVAFFAVLKPF
jgi:uncharacterized membrane protein